MTKIKVNQYNYETCYNKQAKEFLVCNNWSRHIFKKIFRIFFMCKLCQPTNISFFVIVDIVVQTTTKMINTGRQFVELNASRNVNDSEDFDSEQSFSLYELNENSTNTFDEKSYIKSILESQIRDLENNNSELSDYERAVLNKYMNDIDTNNDICDSSTQPKFPVQQSNDSLTTFPTNEDEMIARNSSVTDKSLVASENVVLHSADKSTILNQTQVVNNKRNNVSKNRNARSVLRRQFSIWVGVTSCLWGLLLYLDKTYF